MCPFILLKDSMCAQIASLMSHSKPRETIDAKKYEVHHYEYNKINRSSVLKDDIRTSLPDA